MENGYTKSIRIGFAFDDEGNIIDGSKEGQKDSRFVGVTFFDSNGERSSIGDKPAVIFTPYSNMTNDQKIVFNTLITDYINLKDQ